MIGPARQRIAGDTFGQVDGAQMQLDIIGHAFGGISDLGDCQSSSF